MLTESLQKCAVVEGVRGIQCVCVCWPRLIAVLSPYEHFGSSVTRPLSG